MVSINYSTKEVCCKIVYYGPGLSGKTTNLQYVHEKAPQNTRGKLISLATEADRTLYFDFLPINIGSINGFAAKFQLYTVPGQVYYNATRKLVLRGVDGVVFVADSQSEKMDDNIESLANLKENLIEYGYDLNDLPIVIQYNKSDLPTALSVERMDERLNPHGWPSFAAAAFKGVGVFDTLKMVMKLVLDKAKRGGSKVAPRISANTDAVTKSPTMVASATQNEAPQSVPVSAYSSSELAHNPPSPPTTERVAATHNDSNPQRSVANGPSLFGAKSSSGGGQGVFGVRSTSVPAIIYGGASSQLPRTPAPGSGVNSPTRNSPGAPPQIIHAENLRAPQGGMLTATSSGRPATTAPATRGGLGAYSRDPLEAPAPAPVKRGFFKRFFGIK